ncbi:MAG TPA: proton-conducting transporter membrane subunit, partial [Candidatus Paceibacterota bacterium]
WQPDADASAPAPIAALLSGVLINAALFAVLRYKALTDAALGSSAFTNELLLAFGTLTLAVAAAFILSQADYKRLLAYSSMEHMGFMVLALGLGPAGVVAGVIELIGHAFAKSMLFIGTGNIVVRFRSTKFARVSGVRHVLPFTGALFFAGTLMLLAVPPSPLFVSEYLTIAASITTHPFVIGIALLSFVIILAGFIRLIVPFIFGDVSTGESGYPVVQGESWNLSHTVMVLHLVILIGFFALIMSGIALPVVERIAATIS